MENAALKILNLFMSYRRSVCTEKNCGRCADVHLEKISQAVRNLRPVTFVLPAFPGKSPNPEKVLGTLPDEAERLSLKFLQELCHRVKDIYSPGARIILCSDGRVFSDVVGMNENDVSSYQKELMAMIHKEGLRDLSTFNLDEVYPDRSFGQMRDELMKTYGRSLEVLKFLVKNDPETRRMYCGITRFLVEDMNHSRQKKSRSAMQKEARLRAYEVIRRSNAWTDLISRVFPEALRLSIHPQGCGSKKLGIRLVADESWMTPWHGVAVETSEGFVLRKRSEALEMGAELILSSEGLPSHYSLIASQKVEVGESLYAV